MDRTDQHGLPYLAADQAQKHVTVNEGLRMLDALVGASARSASVTAEPAAPAPGEAYILPNGAAGPAWDGFAIGTYAVFQDGAWAGFAPRAGLSVFVQDEGVSRIWDGAAWAVSSGGAAETTPSLGVNAAADATNKLVVKSDAVLHSHDDVSPGTGDVRHVLNKAGPDGTASFVFQTGYGARAEIGLTGSDDFAFKVSPDGATWYTALTIDRNTGAVTLPNTAGGIAPIHEVWAVLGAGNAVGRAPNSQGAAQPSETYQLDQGGTLVAAATPLDHGDPAAGALGIDAAFAAAWQAAAPEGSTLTFVPCGLSGTGFTDGRWQAGGDLYAAAVARTNDAVEAVRGARGTVRLGGFLWLQGEADRAMTGSVYEDALIGMIGALRADVIEAEAATPFLLAPMTPEAVANGGGAVDGVHRAVPDVIAHAGLAANTGTAGLAGDEVHYDEASVARIGQRLQARVATARANVPAAPGAVVGLVAESGGEGEVTLRFDAAPPNRGMITAYEVQVDGALFAGAPSAATTRTLTGLDAGGTYAVAVRAVNVVGAGPWSAVVSAVAGGAAHPYPDALGYWQFGADNPGWEEFGGGRALSLRQDAPTNETSHVALAATNRNGLLTDLDEPTALTVWAVLRTTESSPAQMLLGTFGPASQTGGGAFINGGSVTMHMRGNPTQSVSTGARMNDADGWTFVAYSLGADGSYLYYVGSGGGAFVQSGAGTRTAPTHNKKIALGNVHYGGTGFVSALHAAELGVLSGARDRAALDALYAEAKARQAARGNAVR